MDLEDPELSGANSLLFLIRICEENGPGGSGALGSKFLIVFNRVHVIVRGQPAYISSPSIA